MFNYDKNADALVAQLDKYDLKDILKSCWYSGTQEIYDVMNEIIGWIEDTCDHTLADGLFNYWSADEFEVYLKERYNINFYEEVRMFMGCPSFIGI